ncbi:hypothetical protein [Sphingomonas sp. PvP018]|uniref:hypothetical protein n=1 Tax=Sphingomonas sp. PvP018 TaxID=2817852 RepID=UPI001DC07275|nr:hypothetical protein [Sphingomonas sp. PvP018]MBP2513829.1 hypothetical protein [Sphingomonas sp. PvP018]
MRISASVRRSTRHLLLACAAIPFAPMASAQPASSPERRAEALASKMTLEEKASLLISTSPAIPRLDIADY